MRLCFCRSKVISITLLQQQQCISRMQEYFSNLRTYLNICLSFLTVNSGTAGKDRCDGIMWRYCPNTYSDRPKNKNLSLFLWVSIRQSKNVTTICLYPTHKVQTQMYCSSLHAELSLWRARAVRYKHKHVINIPGATKKSKYLWPYFVPESVLCLQLVNLLPTSCMKLSSYIMRERRVGQE